MNAYFGHKKKRINHAFRGTLNMRNLRTPYWIEYPQTLRFLNERTRVPHILSVDTYWSESTGIDRKGEFRVVICLARGW